MENAKNISVVFGQRTQLWWDIPVQDSFRLLGDIYEVNAADFQRSLGELTEVLDLDDLLSVPARQLSLGQRMRCDLAAALIHSPKVLYLDEPTISLDVAVKGPFPRVHLGKLDSGEIVQLMGFQAGWLVVLWFGANWAWRRAFKALEAQGG